MSERNEGKFAGAAITVLLVIWTITWYGAGKRVADVWYAKNPVVKEVETPLLMDERECWTKGGELVTRARPTFLSHNCELPAPPKPKKKSKRHLADNPFKYGSVYTPGLAAQPLPEKEPAPHQRIKDEGGKMSIWNGSCWIPMGPSRPDMLSECDCKDYGMGLICTCPADFIHMEGYVGGDGNFAPAGQPAETKQP